MVFYFINNASLFNMPYSLYRMFNIERYEPGAFVLAPEHTRQKDELLLRKGENPEAYIDFPVNAADYEIIDLFNWQEQVKDMISQMQFVRMVDIQTETLSKYIQEGKVKADYEVPMSNSIFRCFYKETVLKYTEQYGWELINPANMKERFMKMVEEMDMSYSYKPVLLIAMLECCDEKGRVLVEDIVDYFIDFYEDRKKKGLIV